MIDVSLPWPHKDLSPNGRAHFMAVSRAKKDARTEADWATRAVKPLSFKHDGSRLKFLITAYPPDKRDRDDDNVLASCKAYRDGCADALGIDDKLFDQRFQWGEPVKGGSIVLSIGGGE